MMTKFITKPDKNGNINRLLIDCENRKIFYNSTIFSRSDAIQITRNELQEIRKGCIDLGYTEV